MSSDCYCDYEPATIYQARSVKAARKQHKCEECGRTIEIGQPYEYVFGIWDGCEGEFKTCRFCCDLRQWVQNNIPCFCWAHGNMIQDAKDAIEDAYRRARGEVTGVQFGFLRRLHFPEKHFLSA